VFRRRAVAQAELGQVLPRELAGRLDLRTLRAVSARFVDERLHLREGDILFSVRLRATRRLVYVLVEHQSRPAALMPFRGLQYTVRIWEAILQDSPRTRRLPPVIVVVFHHGRRRWTAPKELAQLLDLEGIPDAARQYLPSLRLLVDDVARVAEHTLRERGGPPLFAAAVAVLARAATMRSVERSLGPFRDVLAALARDADSVAAHEALWQYVLNVSSVQPHRIVAFIRSLTDTPNEATMPTAAQQLIEQGRREGRQEGRQQGRQEGRQQGRQEGRQQGRQEGRRLQVRKQLELKFGALPADVRARVSAGTPAQLDRWGARLLTATSLSGVFRGARRG
jgi:hypothetical protein